MFTKIYEWTKANKFATFLIFFLVAVIAGIKQPSLLLKGEYGDRNFNFGTTAEFDAMGAAPSEMMLGYDRGMIAPAPQYPPVTGSNDRKVVKNATVSIQVENVSQTVATLKSKVEELKGYVVNANHNKPEFGENATLTVRVPTESLETLLAYTRENSVKVVNEDMYNTDITDQYVDTETRLTQLRGQLSRLQEIMRVATTVDEIMKVQPYIENLQSQIENLEGQNRYADATSKMSLVTIYLSTDELSLPYTPDLSWRPQAVFKNATRSLLMTMQKIGTGVIWVGVYSVVIVPALTIVFIAYMAHKKKQS